MFSACWTPRALPSSVPALMRDLTASCWSWVEIRVRAKVTAGCWSCVQMRVRVLHSTTLCIILDLEQHRCKRTVYGSFLSEDSRCGATPLLRDCVHVNSFGTGSQHIPDREQHPYHMRVNPFARFDNLDLTTPLLRDGVRVNSFTFFMYYYDVCLFLRCLHPVTLGVAFI